MTETIITAGHAGSSAGARVAGGRLLVPLEELQAAAGWELKPEGLCRDEECVPIPAGERSAWLTGGMLDLTAFAAYRGDAVAYDPSHHAWSFVERRASAGPASLEAPDFTLPDLAGRPHSLSDYRGRRVFLVSWASW
jgi:hypothetical protein